MKKVIIGLLIGAILGVGGNIIYDKFYLSNKGNSKETKNNEEIKMEEKKEELLDIYSEQVQELYKKSHTMASWCYPMQIAESNMNIDFYKQNAIYFAVSDYWFAADQSITYEDINNQAKKIFGKAFNLEDKDYDLANYDYDSATKTYKFNGEGWGCTASEPATDIHLYKAVKNDKQISLYESVIYSHVENATGDYYSDSALTKQIDNCYDIYSKECHDKSAKYKFVFTLEDDNYILTDIQKVEE